MRTHRGGAGGSSSLEDLVKTFEPELPRARCHPRWKRAWHKDSRHRRPLHQKRRLGRPEGGCGNNMGNNVFDPKLICFQIVAMQCLYYLLNGAVLEGFNLIFGTSVSLTQIFTTKGLETESAEGLLNITAVLCSFVAGALLLCLVVEKSKKCLDFSATLFIVHIIACSMYESFPRTWLWWLVNLLGIAVMVFLGEFLCARSELRDIPIFVSSALDA